MRKFSPQLNVFQRVILQWERLHPYNAAQAMRLTSSPSIELLTRCWRATLASAGIARVWHDGERVYHEFSHDTIARVKVTRVEPETSLDQYLSNQLNLAFDPAVDEVPFRPFMCPTTTGTMIGVTYHHWVCDSFSIRMLLRKWLQRLIAPTADHDDPLLPARHGYWHHFGPAAAGWPFIPTLLQQLTFSARMRRCRRIKSDCNREFPAEFSQCRSAAGLVSAVRQASRKRGVKVNDMFLVALARTVADLVPLEPAGRRCDLALGSIVDLRNLPGRPVSDAFGLFLGFTTSIVRPNMLSDTQKLLASIANQSKLARERRLAQASQIRMAMGLWAGSIFRPEKLREFYRKRMPLAGGISNVTLHNSWAADAYPRQISEYVRVSPTGPFMPLVLTPTTLVDSLHLGVTTRTPGTNGIAGRNIGERFFEELTKLT